MSRLAPLGLDSLDDEGRSLMDRAARAMGFLPNDALTMARVPGLADAVFALVGAVYRPGRVAMETKRLVALMNSTASGCRYCQGHNRFGALQGGIGREKLDALWDYEHSPLFDERERAALTVARLSALQPNAVEDEHFEALKAHYTEDEIAEIIAVIALFGFLNRWNDTVQTDIEEEPARALSA